MVALTFEDEMFDQVTFYCDLAIEVEGRPIMEFVNGMCGNKFEIEFRHEGDRKRWNYWILININKRIFD